MKKIHINKFVLVDLYFNKTLSLNQVAKKLHISNCTIEARLKESGYKLRGKFEAKKLINQSGINNPSYKDGRTLKKYFCKCGKEISYLSFVRGKNRNIKTICQNCYLKIVGYFNKGKIRTEEHKKIYSLSKGGTGIPYSDCIYPKEFYYIRESIRKRDDYKCLNCGMTEEEHLIVYGQVLHVHHIDYDKQNCNDDNLASTCCGCNQRANYNKDYWQKFYTNKIITILNKENINVERLSNFSN